jgi:hypothetical protein
MLVANAFISPCNTQTMHIKSFYTQKHCYVSLKTSYPGLLVPEADAIRSAFSLFQQLFSRKLCIYICMYLHMYVHMYVHMSSNSSHKEHMFYRTGPRLKCKYQCSQLSRRSARILAECWCQGRRGAGRIQVNFFLAFFQPNKMCKKWTNCFFFSSPDPWRFNCFGQKYKL